MADSHDLTGPRVGDDAQLGGEARLAHHERVIASHLHGVGQAAVQPAAVVEHALGLAVDGALGARDPGPEVGGQGLVAEADPQDRDAVEEGPDHLERAARLLRRARARRDEQVGRLEGEGGLEFELVVAVDERLGLELTQGLDEVEGERVVVVDDEDARGHG